MSSILQSHGRTRTTAGGRVQHELFVYQVRSGEPAELSDLAHPDGGRRSEPKLYRIWRTPSGQLGQWVLWRLNGVDRMLDLSIPSQFEMLPRGAKPLTDKEAAAYWFGTRAQYALAARIVEDASD